MKVSFYKNVTKPASTKSVDIIKILDDIKSEKYKTVLSKIRLENDKSKRSKLKVDLLPCVTFGGVFTHRKNAGLKEASGFAMLDYDGIEDLPELIEAVNKDIYTYSSFISPSGNGFKVLVKIPPVDSDKVYKEYYKSIQEHFNKYAETDESTKDISRATFISVDKDLFLNLDSTTFTDKFVPKERPITPVTNIPLTDQNEIAERLEKWFKKNYSTTVNRNNNLHAFARQFNSFGLPQHVCEDYLLRYEQPDFRESEIKNLIKSAYSHTAEHGVASFEDTKKVKEIKMRVVGGTDEKAIKSKYKDLPEEALQNEIERHKDQLKLDEFWYYTDNDVIKMATFRFKTYLESNNISKYYPSDNSGYLFIKKDKNFINEFDENRIKDFTLNNLLERGEIEAFELCANNLTTFSQNYLSLLGTSDIEIQRDSARDSYIYYKNTAVKITKDEFKLTPYSELPGLVWSDQVIDRDLEIQDESDGEFKTFIWNISGKQKDRYYTFKSVLGYLLHSYQNEGKPKVIIFNDEMVSDVPNGGSGKGLLHKAIGHIKKLSSINGKGFDPTSQFAYQTVGTDTQVLLFDDIDKNFKFENLFSLITEGLIIEKKGKDAIQLPFSESPKISISTNYTVKGEGSSHNRRVFEVELSSHYNDKNTPEDEFGHLLFSEWTPKEWVLFDNYMIRCIQYYLKNGLVAYETVNLDYRKLINDTNKDFLEFMDNYKLKGARFSKTSLKDAFTDEYDDYKYAKWFSTNLFNKWIVKYCEFKKYTLEKGKTNGIRYIEVIGSEK